MTRPAWAGQGSTTERGYGWAWQKRRKRIIARDKGLCQECLRTTGRVTVFRDVDHIIPRAKGGTDDDANLECLCADHHDAKSAREAAEGQGRTWRPKVRIGLDGWPVD